MITKVRRSLKRRDMIQQILVNFMLAALTQILSGSVKADRASTVYPRQVNLSGNVFHFSMPEDFSKDMPAYDMVENLDISDSSIFDNPEYGGLIRRWWDIKEPGWFGKALGTVMMNISIERVAENQQLLIHSRPYNIRDRMDFMLMLDDRYHQMYDAYNAEVKPDALHYDGYHSDFATVSRREILATYRELIANHQKWINYSIAAPYGQLIINSAIPVTDATYLEVSFTYSANDGIAIRQLGDQAFPKMALIEESFRIDYAPGNPFAEIVGEDWMKQTNTDVLNQHYDEVLKLFYGPDPEATLLEIERKNKELAERDEREVREAQKHDPL